MVTSMITDTGHRPYNFRSRDRAGRAHTVAEVHQLRSFEGDAKTVAYVA